MLGWVLQFDRRRSLVDIVIKKRDASTTVMPGVPVENVFVARPFEKDMKCEGSYAVRELDEFVTLESKPRIVRRLYEHAARLVVYAMCPKPDLPNYDCWLTHAYGIAATIDKGKQ